MRIDELKLNHIRMKLSRPFETSFGRIKTRDCIVVEALSDNMIGLGECVADREPGYSYETTITAWHIIKDYLAPALIGQEIDSVGELQHKMSHVRGHPMAKAAIEMVYWDLLGKRDGISLVQMLGGQRKQVDVGVSIGIQDSPKALVDTVTDYLAQGYKRVKIKIKPGRDVEDTMSVRCVYPELQLQVDANSAYTLDSAAVLQPLDELDLLLIEQPLAEDDLWDHSQLQARFATPICLDESIQSPRHARQAIEMGSCRVINIKTGRVGGLSQALAIHDLCLAQDVPVWCGGMLETGIGRSANLALASLPNFKLPGDISATERYYEEDITQEIFTLNSNSTIDVPEGPGLGVSIDQKALKRVTLDTLTMSDDL